MKINRNAHCPCGSGKKFKRCCGSNGDASMASSAPGQSQAAWQQLEMNLRLGVGYYQAGNLAQAEAICLRILRQHPDHADALNLLGVIAAQTGENELAVELINRAIASNPRAPQFYNNLGNALKSLGRLDRAVDCFNKALRLKPDFAEAYSNLGSALEELDRLDAAIECYRRALRLNPNSPQTYNSLGNALRGQNRLDEAMECYSEALRLRPDYTEAHNNLGNLFYQQHKLEAAIECYQKAVSLRPDLAELHNNLGNAFKRLGKIDSALECYRRALACNPDTAGPYIDMGNALLEQSQLEMAIDCYRNALRLSPDCAMAYNNLGNAFIRQNRLDKAEECYRNAIRLAPDFAEAHDNLGNLFYRLGDLDAAMEFFRTALRLSPSNGRKITVAMMENLPIIARSYETLLDSRRRFEEAISLLLEQDITLQDPAQEIDKPHFYLAYQGFNDLPLLKQMARMYAKACPSLLYTAPHCLSGAAREGDQKIRIGFISRFFTREHIIWKVTKGIIANLSRQHFSVTIFFFDQLFDEMYRLAQPPDDCLVHLPMVSSVARERIAQQKLDLLFYTDIGMEPFTYFLAFSRLAPVQCVWTGHPVTTGIENLDYFISAENDEVDNAQEHYSEQLVLLKSRPAYHYRPSLAQPLKPRSYFGLDQNSHIYLCPMTPFKFHPEFDEVMASILRADRAGQIVLVEDERKRLFELLLERFGRTMPDVADRIRFVPRQSADNFRNLLAVSDVILDTLHFGGGTTSCEALGIGVPVVTLPGQFLRGRGTYALYKLMGLTECVAHDKEDYVKIAVRLAADPAFRERVREEILARNSVLYEDSEAVREMEQFFIESARRARSSAVSGVKLGGPLQSAIRPAVSL